MSASDPFLRMHAVDEAGSVFDVEPYNLTVQPIQR